MMLEKGEYTVDRKALIEWGETILFNLIKLSAKQDVIKGGEFIITAQDLLEHCVAIPAYLINENLPKECAQVHHSIITITYKQPKDEIFTTIITKQ